MSCIGESMRHAATTVIASLLVVCALGCAPSNDPTSEEGSRLLQGTVDRDAKTRVPDVDLHVAVVWMGGADRFSVSQDVVIDGELPTPFALELVAPPPGAA